MQKSSTLVIKFVIGLILLLIVVGLYISIYGIWAKRQNSIHITPEEFITVLQNNGYVIENVYYDDYVPGPIAKPLYALRFNLYLENEKYGVYVSLQKSWDYARNSVKSVNALNKRMNGGYAYAFELGDLFVQIIPSHKDVGKQLYRVLRENID